MSYRIIGFLAVLVALQFGCKKSTKKGTNKQSVRSAQESTQNDRTQRSYDERPQLPGGEPREPSTEEGQKPEEKQEVELPPDASPPDASAPDAKIEQPSPEAAAFAKTQSRYEEAIDTLSDELEETLDLEETAGREVREILGELKGALKVTKSVGEARMIYRGYARRLERAMGPDAYRQFRTLGARVMSENGGAEE